MLGTRHESNIYPRICEVNYNDERVQFVHKFGKCLLYLVEIIDFQVLNWKWIRQRLLLGFLALFGGSRLILIKLFLDHDCFNGLDRKLIHLK